MRISKHEKNFAQGYTPSWSEKVFGVKELKSTVPWTYVIEDLNYEKIVGTFFEKVLKRTNQKRV